MALPSAKHETANWVVTMATADKTPEILVSLTHTYMIDGELTVLIKLVN